MALRTVYPVHGLLLLVAESYIFGGSVRNLLRHLAIVLHSLSRPRSIMRYFLPRVIKGYVDSPICVSYRI